jgi:RNA polymerase sigma-70 factor (ECF subfamily)
MNANGDKLADAFEGDTELIRAFQAGNKKAFDRLVMKHKDRVFNLCYRFLGDYEEANDSAQETFIKVYVSLNKFRMESKFVTWVYRIAVNTCKNKLKSLEYKKKKRTLHLDNPGVQEIQKSSIKFQEQSPSPLNGLERKERIALIQNAINRLPDEQKAVVVLRDVEGLSYEDISRITGINPGTVKSRIARARLELREQLRSIL